MLPAFGVLGVLAVQSPDLRRPRSDRNATVQIRLWSEPTFSPALPWRGVLASWRFNPLPSALCLCLQEAVAVAGNIVLIYYVSSHTYLYPKKSSFVHPPAGRRIDIGCSGVAPAWSTPQEVPM